jgi:hypothetical protein
LPGGKPGLRALQALGLVGLGYALTYATLAPRPESKRPRPVQETSPPDIGPLPTNLKLGGPRPVPIALAPDLDPVKDLSLGPLLAVVVEPKAQAALILRQSGVLELCYYPTFWPHSRYSLEQPGYRAVVDSARGRLYVAASGARALGVNPYGDRPVGRGDLHIYDVKALFNTLVQVPAPTIPAGALGLLYSAHGHGPLLAAYGLAAYGLVPRKPPVAGLHPQTVIPLGGDVSHLLPAPPDDEAIYYLLHLPEGDRVGRISTASMAATGETYRPQGRLEALCLAPDGKALYAGGPGTVVVLDPASLRPRAEHHVQAVVRDLGADAKGRLFLAEQGQDPEIIILDGSSGAELGRGWSQLPGRNYLAVMPDGGRLYVGSSGRISSLLRSLRAEPGPTFLTPSGYAYSDPIAAQRGEFFLTPDMGYLVTRGGKVYRLAPPEAQRLHSKFNTTPSNPLIGEPDRD